MHSVQQGYYTTSDNQLLLGLSDFNDDEQDKGNVVSSITGTLDWQWGKAWIQPLGTDTIVLVVAVPSHIVEKEIELERLIGKEIFQALDREARELLINIVGVLDFGVPIDIERTMNYSIYDE